MSLCFSNYTLRCIFLPVLPKRHVSRRIFLPLLLCCFSYLPAMASALSGEFVTARNLAVCTSGYWIMAPVGGIGYPVFGVSASRSNGNRQQATRHTGQIPIA